MFQRMRKTRIGALLCVATIAVGLASATPVFAQGGGPGGGFGGGPGGGGGRGGPFGGFAQMFDPSVNSQDIDTFTTVFSLDKTQKEVVKQLFDAYQQQFAASAKTIRAQVDAAREEARESGDPGAFGDVMAKAGEFRKTRTDMEQSFFTDMKAVLTEKQLESWPKFERDRRRASTINTGLMNGERVDVVKLVDDLKLPAEARAGLTDMLDAYAVELDPALVARNKEYEEFQTNMRDLFGDQDAMAAAVKKGREASVKVRDINRRYASQIEAVLPEDKQAAFETAFKRESFPQIYRPSYTSRVIDAALKLPDLTEDQKSAVASIQESFTRELAGVQKEQEAATEEAEMNFSPANFGRGGRGQGGGRGGDSKTGELRAKRREMETQTVEKIEAVLSEAQRDKLPTRDQGAGNDGGPGRDGGNDRGDRGGRGGDNGNNNDNGGANGRRQRQPNRLD